MVDFILIIEWNEIIIKTFYDRILCEINVKSLTLLFVYFISIHHYNYAKLIVTTFY